MKRLIYHHNDNDGYLAAAIADEYLRNLPNEDDESEVTEIRYTVGDYEGTVPEPLLDWADEIYILDYSLPNKYMDRYFKKIIWIDHHKTSIANVAVVELQHNNKLRGIREIGKSGCLLTWEYFHPEEEPPIVVKLINDRDVWVWRFGEDTAAFHEMTRMFMDDLMSWQMLLKSDKVTEAYVKQGKMLLEYIHAIVDSYNRTYAREGMFMGHPVVFLNGTGTISGELHKRLREDFPMADFAVVFIWNKNNLIRVSLYRQDGLGDDKVDVSQIATQFGGGGHAGAAGFHIEPREWAELLM